MLATMGDARHVDRRMGGKGEPDGLDALIAGLAAHQHDAVARRQLLELGAGPAAVDLRLRRRRLRTLYRGVYRLGAGPVARPTRWMAAVLAGGPDAVLSHRSAAALWCIYGEGGRIELSVPTNRRPRGRLTFHRYVVPRDERTLCDGIPVTTVPRTLFDLATVLRPRQLERTLLEAENLKLHDPLSLADLLRRYPRRPGSPAIRALLDARAAGANWTRSELEVAFLELVDELELPQPETNVVIEGFEVDALWRERRVAVELDSRAYHDNLVAFERDRERDRILNAAEWRPIRITSRQLKRSRAAVARDLSRMLAPPQATLAK